MILDYNLTMVELLSKLIIIFAVTGLLLLFFAIFFLIGKWKENKELREE
jgi:hypothetical protein